MTKYASVMKDYWKTIKIIQEKLGLTKSGARAFFSDAKDKGMNPLLAADAELKRRAVTPIPAPGDGPGERERPFEAFKAMVRAVVLAGSPDEAEALLALLAEVIEVMGRR